MPRAPPGSRLACPTRPAGPGGVPVTGGAKATKDISCERGRRLTFALARLHALLLVLATGTIPPLPVGEDLVCVYHDALDEFTKAGVVECEALRINENQLFTVRVGKRGALRAPRYARYVAWPIFVTTLHTATLYCDYVLGKLSPSERPIGFAR